MKVLLINAVCGVGSTGRIVVDLVDTLEAQGFQGKIAFGIDKVKGIDKSKTIKFNNKIGYYSHTILARITDKTGLYSDIQTKYLIRKIKKFKPDIIHLHNLHGHYINYRVLFRYLQDVQLPVVWTLHDCWSFTGHCAHFVSANCMKWKDKCENCPLIRSYPVCYFGGDVKNNFRKKKSIFTSINKMVLVTPSKWLGNFASQSFLGKYPVKVINNGINLNIFKPIESDFRRKYNLEDKKIVLGVSNVWNRKKGLDDVLTLAKKLSPEYTLVLVGLNDELLSTLPQNIIGIKRTANTQELAQIYSVADVFINLTYEDTFPTVNLEAQACRTPVVTYDTGGCKETILDGFGQVVEQGNMELLLETIKKWSNKKHSIQNLSVEVLSKDKCYQKYIDLYKELYQ